MSKFYEMLNGASDDLLMESFEAVNVTAVKIDAIEEFVQEHTPTWKKSPFARLGEFINKAE